MKDTADTVPRRVGSVKPTGALYCAASALCGAVFAVPLTEPRLWFIAWFSLAPLLYSETRAVRRGTHKYLIAAWLRGMAFFTVYGFMTYSWFWQLYPLDFLGYGKAQSLAVVLAAFICLPTVQGAVSAFIFVLSAFFTRHSDKEKHPVAYSLFVSSLWVCAEWLQSRTWLGVPWGRLAAGQTYFAPAIQTASLFGSYFVSFLIIMSNALISGALPVKGSAKRAQRVSAVIAALVIIFNFGFGAVRISKNDLHGTAVRCAVLQGNILFSEKWSQTTQSVRVYTSLASQAAKDGAKLIVLPETALPCDIAAEPHRKNSLEYIAEKYNADILCGAFRKDGEKLYNSVIMLPGYGSDTVYDKRHPVPFGEYIPARRFTENLMPSLVGLTKDTEITGGCETAVFDTAAGKAGSLICFDSVYESLCLESVRDGAEIICISTNDSWFDGSAAKEQHNSHAILRAVENGRYVLRSANTGISSVISPYGKTVAKTESGERCYAAADAEYIEARTLYGTVGNIAVPLCALYAMSASLVLILSDLRRRKSDKGDPHDN